MIYGFKKGQDIGLKYLSCSHIHFHLKERLNNSVLCHYIEIGAFMFLNT